MPNSPESGGDRAPMAMTPFADEASSSSVGGLAVENRLDRVSLYGSLDLTRDRQGLEDAQRLRALLDAIVGALEGKGDSLPERLVSAPGATRIPNPFG